MARITLLVSAIFAIITSFSASAATILPVVSRYQDAGKQEIWTGTKGLPKILVENVSLPTPSRAYLPPHRAVFLQNERIIVCNRSCDGTQNVTPTLEGNDYVVKTGDEKARKKERERDASVIRQATVYYWINKLYDDLEQLGYSPSRPLVVMVDRDTASIETGEEQRNNAFFNDRDWTLSFLPASGRKMLPSAYDPTVSMHEATHAVFQELMGSILNREMYGLHEAFADYFALATIGAPVDAVLGTVMTRGKAIRRVDDKLVYTNGMEVHDLGNVVLTALWRSRALIGNKILADKIALETVRKVSLNPYGSAGDVFPSYMQVLKALGSAELKANPGLFNAVLMIWAKTQLVPTLGKPNLAVLEAPIDDSKYVSTSFQMRLPPELAAQYGLKTLDEQVLTLIESRPGPDGVDARWYLIALEKDSVATPIWVLYSPSLGAIMTAYDISGQKVTPSDSVVYSKVLSIGQGLPELLDWTTGYNIQMRDFFAKKGFMRFILKPSRDKKTDSFVSINGKLYGSVEHKVRFKRTLLNRLLSLLGGLVLGDFIKSTRPLRDLVLITVPTSEIKTAVKLPELAPGETFVGYRLRTVTGFEITVQIVGMAN